SVTITSSTPNPVLALQKSHTGTFTQGQTAQWLLTVLNTAGGSSTNGTITLTDTLPAGFTLGSFSSTGGWGGGGAGTVTCTTTTAISGGGTAGITLTVNVPATSPASVTNTAGVFGGGDPAHTNSTNAATASDTVSVVQTHAAPTVVSYSVLFGSES